jgi:hypothetical protein
VAEHELFALSKQTAEVVAGSAVATGGYAYWTKARGWRMVVGIATTFCGGVVFHPAAQTAVALVVSEPSPRLTSGVAASCTLGALFVLRKWIASFDPPASLPGAKDISGD